MAYQPATWGSNDSDRLEQPADHATGKVESQTVNGVTSMIVGSLSAEFPLGEISLYAADDYVGGVAQETGQTIASSTLAGGSNGTALTWSQVLFDTTSGAWDVANPSRLVVPAGATKMMISSSINFPANGTGSRWARLTTGPIPSHVSNILLPTAHATISQPVPINTGWIDVVAGTYFELRALQDSGSSLVLAMGNASNKGGSTFLRASFK